MNKKIVIDLFSFKWKKAKMSISTDKNLLDFDTQIDTHFL
nr:MAG TPA: hypothetical protein [Caudoviricetes sp.]